jgi:malate dehydrogenase (oxaloacetate-decarboxylating)
VKVPEVFQVETPCVLGSLASVLNAVTGTGLVLEHLSTLGSDRDRTLWEITAEIDATAHAELPGRLNALPAVRFVGWSDRVFDRHRGDEVSGPQSRAP